MLFWGRVQVSMSANVSKAFSKDSTHGSAHSSRIAEVPDLSGSRSRSVGPALTFIMDHRMGARHCSKGFPQCLPADTRRQYFLLYAIRPKQCGSFPRLNNDALFCNRCFLLAYLQHLCCQQFSYYLHSMKVAMNQKSSSIKSSNLSHRRRL